MMMMMIVVSIYCAKRNSATDTKSWNWRRFSMLIDGLCVIGLKRRRTVACDLFVVLRLNPS